MWPSSSQRDGGGSKDSYLWVQPRKKACMLSPSLCPGDQLLTQSHSPGDPLGISPITAAYRGAGGVLVSSPREGIPGPLRACSFCGFACSDTSLEDRCCHCLCVCSGADPRPPLYPSLSVVSDVGGRWLECTVLEVTMLPVGPRYPDVLTDPR